jgi:hypothetical protein
MTLVHRISVVGSPRVTLLPLCDPQYFPRGVKHRYTRISAERAWAVSHGELSRLLLGIDIADGASCAYTATKPHMSRADLVPLVGRPQQTDGLLATGYEMASFLPGK